MVGGSSGDGDGSGRSSDEWGIVVGLLGVWECGVERWE